MSNSGYTSGAFVTTTAPRGRDTIQDALATWPGADGWVQYASGIVARRSGQEHTTGSGPVGVPLCGEWVRDGVSYALRQVPKGWVLVTSTRVEGDHRIEHVSYLSDVLNDATLCYEVEWKPVLQGTPAVGVWTPVSSRFIGWK